MKKMAVLTVFIALVAAGFAQAQERSAATATPYNFGDRSSQTLATKAWKALADKNLEGAVVFSSKCIEMYADKARAMQAGLKEYPAGDEKNIFSFWALNDVSTCLFIRGEAYRLSGNMDQAKKDYQSVVSEYSFGQAYDNRTKSFWKPSDASKDKLNMINKGLDLDFGDMTSSFITTKAWGALAKKDTRSLVEYVNKNVELYGAKAKEMQASLREFPWESQEKIFSFWALNDVGTCMFILGQAYVNDGKNDEAVAVFKQLVDNYGYAQAWDPQGWFWKPAEAAQQKIVELEALKK
jgi:tetratricopeptide (TPR) repeat protein